jgi:hypothetical protein
MNARKDKIMLHLWLDPAEKESLFLSLKELGKKLNGKNWEYAEDNILEIMKKTNKRGDLE